MEGVNHLARRWAGILLVHVKALFRADFDTTVALDAPHAFNRPSLVGLGHRDCMRRAFAVTQAAEYALLDIDLNMAASPVERLTCGNRIQPRRWFRYQVF